MRIGTRALEHTADGFLLDVTAPDMRSSLRNPVFTSQAALDFITYSSY